MSFTYPAFLFALLAITIPVIIHLFNFRKFKTVYFSNVRFLREVKEETQAKSRLKHLLVLIARILAICFLVLAFAQPFIPVSNARTAAGEKAVSIFIDNSFSMDAVNKNGTLLEDAKKKALEILAAYKPSDRFQLLTNDFEGKHQRLVNKEEFIQLMDEVRIGPASKTLAEISSRSFDLLRQSDAPHRSLFILSDLQKSIIRLPAVQNDTGISVNIIPLLAAEKSNVFIDTCWFESPVRQYGQLEKLHVRIRNISDKMLENNSVRLFINDVQKTPASFNLEKDAETEVILSFVSKETGTQQCRIELDDYPVTFDDAFYFSYEVAPHIPVLTISEHAESPYLNKLFSGDSLFRHRNAMIDRLDYTGLSGYNLIVLNGLKSMPSGLAQGLKRFIDNGGHVLVFPSADADLASYKEFLLSCRAAYPEKLDTADTRTDRINLDHEIYRDVFEKKSFQLSNIDLPKVYSGFVMSKSSRSREESLLRLQNGNSLLSVYPAGKGKLYLASVSLEPEMSNLARHAVFVPTMYKIALHSQQSRTLFYTIGKNEAVETKKVLHGENVFHLRGKNNFDVIPEHRNTDAGTEILLHSQVKDAGNYMLFADKDSLMGISFNYNRIESDLTVLNPDELKDEITRHNLFNFNIFDPDTQNLTSELSAFNEGRKLWKICLFLALLFLGAEVLLLRFMKG